jgi:putative hydrolase of the HAD superfamily
MIEGSRSPVETASTGRRTVIFDFGAVLFRWHPVQLMQQALPELAPDDDAARQLMAQVFESFTPDSDWARFDLGLDDEPSLARRIAARTGLPEAAMRRIIDAVPGHLEPQHDTVALFRALKARGHRMVFLSNMPRPYADHLERLNPFVGEFEDGIFSGRVGLVKPWPAMFELASLRFGLNGAPPMFIDDHAGNIEAARRHGWEGLRFEKASQAEAALREQGWL